MGNGCFSAVFPAIIRAICLFNLNFRLFDNPYNNSTSFDFLRDMIERRSSGGYLFIYLVVLYL